MNDRSRYRGVACSTCHKIPGNGDEVLGTTLYVDVQTGEASHREARGWTRHVQTRLVYHRQCLVEILDLTGASAEDFEVFAAKAAARLERRRSQL